MLTPALISTKKAWNITGWPKGAADISVRGGGEGEGLENLVKVRYSNVVRIGYCLFSQWDWVCEGR